MYSNMMFVTTLLLLAAICVVVQGKAPDNAVQVFVKGEGGYYCHKIPYLLRTSANVLIAFAEGRGRDGRDACDDFAGTDLVYKRSLDDGKTWSPLAVLFTNSSSTESNVIGNAAPVQDRSTGRILLPFCRNNEEVFLTFSDDDGLTWASPLSQPHLVLADWKWVGLGPPAGIQLASGRLLIPSYHTSKWKGDGCASHGHTLFSDDHGAHWQIGSEEFGNPYFTNECQAVQLTNGSVLINARTIGNHRVQMISDDEGMTFSAPYVVPTLVEPLEGCEGSMVRDARSNKIYFSDPFTTSLVRLNMTVMESDDNGLTWQTLKTIDSGSVAYSAMQIMTNAAVPTLELLYERSDQPKIVFEPQEIVYVQLSV